MRRTIRLALAGLLTTVVHAEPSIATSVAPRASLQGSQGAWSTGVYRNLFAERGHSAAEIDAKIDGAFHQLFFGDSATQSIYRVQADTSLALIESAGLTTSPDMGAAMLVAVMMEVPAATPVATPVPEMVAVPRTEEVQVTVDDTSVVVASLYVAVALNACVAPTAIEAVAGSKGDLALVSATSSRTPWWIELETQGAPKIIARLPFIERADHPAALPVFVVSRVADSAMVTEVGPAHVVAGGERIATHCVLWSAGMRGAPVLHLIGAGMVPGSR